MTTSGMHTASILHLRMMVFLSDVNVSVLSGPAVPVERL